jgi:hypothetical protein
MFLEDAKKDDMKIDNLSNIEKARGHVMEFS